MPEVKMYCPRHNPEYPADHKFCKVCGDPLIDKPRGASAHCPDCQAEIKEGMRFCKVCGFKLFEEPKIKSKPGHQCGMPVQVGMKFCQACGAPIAAERKRWIIAANSLVLAVGLGTGRSYDYRHHQQRSAGTSRSHIPSPTTVSPIGTPAGMKKSAEEGPFFVTLTVRSTPPGCQVFLDGQYPGQTDVSGRLVIFRGSVSFRSEDAGDSVTPPRSDIWEAKLNGWVGREIGAFCIGTTRRNCNVAPKTRSRNESQIILDLIRTYVR